MMRLPNNVELYVGVLLETPKLNLIVQVRDDKPGISNRGKFSLFGGRSIGHETPRAAAVRELREETLLSVEGGEFMLLGIIPYSVGQILSAAHVYVLRGIDAENLTILEGAGCKTFTGIDLIKHPNATPLCRLAAILHQELFPSNIKTNSTWLYEL